MEDTARAVETSAALTLTTILPSRVMETTSVSLLFTSYQKNLSFFHPVK